jgi:hypothetical protein
MNNLQELSAVMMAMMGTEVEMIAGGTAMIGADSGTATMMIGIIDTGAGVTIGISIRPISVLSVWHSLRIPSRPWGGILSLSASEKKQFFSFLPKTPKSL